MKLGIVLLLAAVCFSCGGYGTPMASAPQAGVVPTIMELSPNNTTAGGAGLTLTVNGSSFGSGAVVKWNGADQTTTFVSANQITAAIPATAIAVPAAIPVTVTNPAKPGTGGIYGTGGTNAATSAAMTFTVQ